MQADFAMAGFLKLIRIFAGPESQPTRVSFEYPAPRNIREYERLFATTAHFGQPFTGLEFPRALLSSSPLHASSELFVALQDQADRARTPSASPTRRRSTVRSSAGKA